MFFMNNDVSMMKTNLMLQWNEHMFVFLKQKNGQDGSVSNSKQTKNAGII